MIASGMMSLAPEYTPEGRPRGGSAVLSIRLTAQEMAAVEAVALATGKTHSQVVREALRQGMPPVRSA